MRFRQEKPGIFTTETTESAKAQWRIIENLCVLCDLCGKSFYMCFWLILNRLVYVNISFWIIPILTQNNHNKPKKRAHSP